MLYLICTPQTYGHYTKEPREILNYFVTEMSC